MGSFLLKFYGNFSLNTYINTTESKMTPAKAAVIMIQIELDPGLTGSGTGIGYSSGSYEAVTTIPVLSKMISVLLL